MSPLTAAACPSCRSPMLTRNFERKTFGWVELGLCFTCQGIWFGAHESPQLGPTSVLELFKLIHEGSDAQVQPLASLLHCPRCGDHLLASQDRVKSGLFSYLRCPQQHGRFIIFAQFMIEKGFVRQLSGAEIDQVKAHIGIVRCTGCGAAVDIRRDSACAHCRAPIAILDAQAVEKALAGYRQAAAQQAALPNPERLAEAILHNERERSRRQREHGLQRESDLADLLLDGVAILWQAIGR
jgi:Zn-finger nucleic acid-binding protein